MWITPLQPLTAKISLQQCNINTIKGWYYQNNNEKNSPHF